MYIYISTTRACAPVQRCSSFLAMEAIANLSWVLREHRAGCRFRPPSCPFVEPAALLLARWPTCSLRNPSKSTLAHDAVAAVVLHEHHLIIRVGAGLIQFVYGSHSRMAADLTLDKNLFSLPFSRVFIWFIYFLFCNRFVVNFRVLARIKTLKKSYKYLKTWFQPDLSKRPHAPRISCHDRAHIGHCDNLRTNVSWRTRFCSVSLWSVYAAW